MSEQNKKVIYLLFKNKSIKQIATTLNMTEREVYTNIKEIIAFGKKIKPIYYYNSDIRYEKGIEEENKLEIKLDKKAKSFRCLVVSDLHIGNKNSNIYLMDEVYEYATKFGINNILNCGDLIEGIYTSGTKTIKSVEEQIETIINEHPYDKNINVFAVLGNHDFHSLHYDNVDIGKIIHDSRYDINTIGYGKGIVSVGKDNILLSHKIGKKNMPDIKDLCKVQLIGHGHEMKTKAYDIFKLCVPTLSYVATSSQFEVVPGFIDMRIDLEKEHFEFIEAKHLIVGNKTIEVSKSSCRLKTLYYNKKR